MGLICSKRKHEQGDSLVRVSPFSRFARRTSPSSRQWLKPSEGSLVSLCLDALAQTLSLQDPRALRSLPPDLCQLLVNRLIDTEALTDDAVLRLRGQHCYELCLDAYPQPIREFWVREFVVMEVLQFLDLSRTEITDHVLGALPALPRCRVLRLDHCPRITDAALTLLGRTPALEELSVAGCDALGPLCVGWIARLSRLRRLNLNACHKLWGLGPLRLLGSSMEELDLGWCNGLGNEDAAAIASLTALRDLRVCHTALTDTGVCTLATLQELTSLSLGGLTVADNTLAELLPAFPNLCCLDLESCNYAGDAALRAASRAGLPLRRLNASYTDVSDEGLSESLRGLSSLEELSLESCTGIGHAGISAAWPHLQHITTLNVSDTDVTNETLAVLARLPKLRRLDLSFTSIDDKGVSCLAKGATALKALNLDCRKVTDEGLHALVRLPALETLSLFGADITDRGCTALGRCTPLKSLEVCSGLVSDSGVAVLATSLRRLKHLSLAQNWKVTNACVPALMKMELTSLNLSHTRVSSSGVVPLATLPSLLVLGLAGTRVRPAAVDRLQRMNPSLEVIGITRA